MTTTYVKRYFSRQFVRGGARLVGPDLAAGLAIAAPIVLPVVAGATLAWCVSDRLQACYEWITKRQGVDELSRGLEKCLADEEDYEQQDGAMTGEDIYLERTEPVVLADSSALVDPCMGIPAVVGRVGMKCVCCKRPLNANDDHQSVSCDGCGYGPIKVRAGRKRRYCRGHFNMIRDAIKEFPQRMDHPNRKLAEQQVYVYMLRRSKELRWTVKDQGLLPALAAMTFIVHSRGELDARKIAQSEFAENAAYEYDVAGSRYPNLRRIYDALRFYA